MSISVEDGRGIQSAQVGVQASPAARDLPAGSGDSRPLGLESLANVRVASVDAYRGFVMLLMASEGLRLASVAEHYPDNAIWQGIAFHTEHVSWVGCSLWDLIQPSFSFLVGVALPFSLASRAARGQSFAKMFLHALWRSLLLIALGIFLRSTGSRQTNFTFEDTLTQIGLGYPFLFLLGFTRPRWQFLAIVGILLAYWGAFALYPLPGPDFNWAAASAPPGGFLHGFAQHWDKNTNFAAAADKWFLNLFPREKSFVYNDGGYLTLSFIPTLATMAMGLLAGNLLRNPWPRAKKCLLLAAVGCACLALGWFLGYSGICPVVKRIWTPSWAIDSTGWTCLLLAAFYLLLDIAGRSDGGHPGKWALLLVAAAGCAALGWYMWRGDVALMLDRARLPYWVAYAAWGCLLLAAFYLLFDITHWRGWAFPLLVVGMNSIAMYCMAHLIEGFITESLRIHLGRNIFRHFGEMYEPVVRSAVALSVLWLICFWMYRRRIFLRI